jgi:2-polyprenyl-3-methyl-5-hydroxy-6-metoxy-1,4-benzoquinol methylase
MKIISPISKSPNVEVVERISSQSIIDLYKRDFDIDVSRFFKDFEHISICKCLDTGFLFYHPVNIAGDELFYDDVKRQMPVKYNVPYYSETKWEYGVCKDFISASEFVYEIGAGNGAFLEELKKTKTANVFGSELNADSIASALNRGIKLEYKTIEQKAQEAVNEFDVVCTFQVLEHVTNISSFLDASLHILKPGGKLIIAVPYNNPFLFQHDKFNTLNLPPHHMGLWNQNAFQSLVKHYPVTLKKIIIEKLPAGGYDFNRFFEINKDVFYKESYPLKKYFDKLYYKWLNRYHAKYNGKNIIAIFDKR